MGSFDSHTKAHSLLWWKLYKYVVVTGNGYAAKITDHNTNYLIKENRIILIEIYVFKSINMEILYNEISSV